MTAHGRAALAWSLLTVGACSGAAAGAPEVPTLDGKKTLAMVNGEPITLDEFLRHLDRVHSGVGEQIQTERQDPSVLLGRLVDARLIVQEARAIGLDETPKIQRALDTHRRQTLRSMLLAGHARTLPGPDPQEVDRLYKDSVRQYEVTSILIEDEQLAAEFVASLERGHAFDPTVVEWVAAGKATGGEAPRYMSADELSQAVTETLAGMEVGKVSPPIPLGRRVAFVKLTGIRYPEDPEARDRALAEATRQNEARLLKLYLEGLRDRLTVVDEAVLASLDFEAQDPGFDALLEDGRVVAKVEGEEPVTVGMLAQEMEERFFHGVGEASRKGKVNDRVPQVLDTTLLDRAALAEARRLKLDTTDEYEARVGEYLEGVLFGAFVERIVEPEVRPSDEALRAYFAQHLDEYSSPAMMRIDSLVFAKREDAERAIDKLRKGADFQWMRANAGGQVAPTQPDPAAGGLVPTAGLPEGVRKAVVGAEVGEARFYADPDGSYRVLLVRQVVPPQPKSFEAVKEQIAGTVFRQQRRAAVDDWIAKLRAASEIEVFATGDELLALLRTTLQAAPE